MVGIIMSEVANLESSDWKFYLSMVASYRYCTKEGRCDETALGVQQWRAACVMKYWVIGAIAHMACPVSRRTLFHLTFLPLYGLFMENVDEFSFHFQDRCRWSFIPSCISTGTRWSFCRARFTAVCFLFLLAFFGLFPFFSHFFWHFRWRDEEILQHVQALYELRRRGGSQQT